MTKLILRAFYVGTVAMLTLYSISAQDNRAIATASANDKYVISAKAGGVNYVEGTVSIARANGLSAHLIKRDEIAVGDRVSTGADGKAEILLNPGSFLRIGANTSFEFKSTSLDTLQVKIDLGTAIFEVYASAEFKVRVSAPNAKLLLIESGVFRIDVAPDGGAKIAVWEGQALLGDHNATLLKRGREAVLRDSSVTVTKFDRGDKDDFEAWSKARGKDIAKQSAKLKNQTVRNSLLSSFNSGGWGMYNSFGVWVYNSFTGGYCFLPFGSSWYSPYGYGYGSGIWGYNLPPVVYTPPVGGSIITPVERQRDRSPVPPFVRMNGSGGRGGRLTENSDNSTDRRVPVYSPPVFVPPSAEPTEKRSPAKKDH